MRKSGCGYSGCNSSSVSMSNRAIAQLRYHLWFAGTTYQGERSVRARGPYKVSKVFVADVLALRQRM